MSSKWHGIDLDALECDLDAFEASLNELEASDVGSVDAPLTPGEYEEVMATAALEILTLTAEAASLRAELGRRARAVRPIQGALEAARAEARGLKAALAAAEAHAQDATARAEAAEVEAASLRAELEDARAQAPAWVAIRDGHLADHERHAL